MQAEPACLPAHTGGLSSYSLSLTLGTVSTDTVAIGGYVRARYTVLAGRGAQLASIQVWVTICTSAGSHSFSVLAQGTLLTERLNWLALQ